MLSGSVIATSADNTKNEPVSLDRPISHNFRVKVVPGDPRKVFPSTIVTSDVEEPPDHLTGNGTLMQALCLC